jgi:hypothetical protein
MVKPSIKGSIFKGAVEDLARLRDQGRVSDMEIKGRLPAEDLALIEGEINISGWYPIDCYNRLITLLYGVEGGGQDAYFVERGRKSARRLIEAGLYQQLAFLPRWEDTVNRSTRDESRLIADYANKLKIVVSMSSMAYSVGKWVVEPDPENPGRVLIAIREAEAYTEPMRLAIEGFLNECAQAARPDHDNLFISERPTPDLLLFRITRDIKDLFPD